MYSGDNYDQFGWAVFMAGGSLAALPKLDKTFRSEASAMKAVADSKSKSQWMLKGDKGWIVYTVDGNDIQLALSKGDFVARYINPRSGETIGEAIQLTGGKDISLKTPQSNVVLWISETQNTKQNEAGTRK